MHLTNLSLTDYRSYAGLELDLGAGVTTFLGPNGQGKTNLVEAIGYVANLSSHRVAQDGPLVRIGATRAILRAAILADERTTTVDIEINPGRANRARVNRVAVPRPRDVLGILRTVLFAPEDLTLVKGEPADRRRFLDELLVTRVPRLAAVRADYERVLKQRNALLKTASLAPGGRRAAKSAALPTLDVWDTHLANAGAALIAARLDLLAALAPLVDKAHAAVAGHGTALMSYRSTVGPVGEGSVNEGGDVHEIAELFVAALAEQRHAELERGTTLVGPHRDDLLLQLAQDADPMPAKGYASHGESWSYALALRLAAYELLRLDGGAPVLILDDVFAELDDTRRARLAELVSTAEQVLVTAAVAADVPALLSGTRYDVAAGEVKRRE